MKFSEYYQEYLSLHQNKTCRLLHFIGQWFTLGTIFLIIKYKFWYAIPIIPFVVYPFAWTGHFFFEKNKPAAFKNPWMAKLSDWRMFSDIIRGKIKLFNNLSVNNTTNITTTPAASKTSIPTQTKSDSKSTILTPNTGDIKLTAALPTYNNSNIIWLQLESLCRQECNFYWELIVCEEQNAQYCYGKKELIERYKSRLFDAGCRNILYIALEKRLPLAKKWWLMAQHAQGSSYALCSSDDYSSPDRFELSHSKLNQGYDWFNIKKGLFLNVQTMATATFVAPNNKRGLSMCTQTKNVKGIKTNNWPWKNVDGWMQKYSKKFYSHPNNVLGLFTDGSNIISGRRRHLYTRNVIKKPFVPPQQKVSEILPKTVINKIQSTKFYYPKNFLNGK